jgi:hypothetical protein
VLVQRSRLSVQPVRQGELERIVAMGGGALPGAKKTAAKAKAPAPKKTATKAKAPAAAKRKR